MQSPIPPLGFINNGAICYFNSLIQSLLSSNTFLRNQNDESIIKLFLKFIIIEKKWDPAFTSKLLHLMGGFQPNQSSSEYFLKLCDYLKLDDLFKTQTETITICKDCGKENKTNDDAVYFMIDNDVKEFMGSTREVEGFNCDKCNKKVSVTIVTQLKAISPILVLSFNKYVEKKNIEYPDGFTIDNKDYRLISTIEHIGGLQGGHYYCRTLRNGKNYKIDDNNVQEIENLNSTENTYMIFYERVHSL